jgi:hypothetical protein
VKINQLAWQLRTGTLALDDGLVVVVPGMLMTSSAEVRATVQRRADEINEIIRRDNIHPATLEELKTIFTKMEKRP